MFIHNVRGTLTPNFRSNEEAYAYYDMLLTRRLAMQHVYEKYNKPRGFVFNGEFDLVLFSEMKFHSDEIRYMYPTQHILFDKAHKDLQDYREKRDRKILTDIIKKESIEKRTLSFKQYKNRICGGRS